MVAVTAQRFSNEKALPDRVAVPLTENTADYVGDYEVTPAIRATISFIDGGLFIDLTGRPQAELFQQSPDVFFLKVADVVLTFERDQAGQVQSVRVLDRGRAIAARKIR